MADPSKYTQGYDFSEFSDANPNSPLPGDRVDNELANISQSTEELRDAIMDVRRSDGRLKNGIVTRDSLADSLTSLIGAWRGQWATATVYAVDDTVEHEGSSYICRVAHTSDVFATDLAAVKWALVAAKGEPGDDGVQTLVEGNAIAVDTTDPNNPVVALSEPLYLSGAAADAGAGDTDDTAAIQATIDARGVNGVIVIPPGNYYVPGDLTIHYAGSPNEGRVHIIADGAIFTGGGIIIVDECQGLTISGLDAPTHVVHLRGCWHALFKSVRVQSYVVGEAAGTGFNSCGWNTWEGGSFQAFIVHENMSTWCNHNKMENTKIAGSGSPFAGTVDYGFEFNANQPVQNLVVDHCDVSGFDTAVYNIGAANTSGDVELDFVNKCYFDSMWPEVAYGRNNVHVSVNGHAASKFIYSSQKPLRGQTKGAAYAESAEWTQGWLPWGAENLIPNGDFNLNNLSLGMPFSGAGGATLTFFTTGGPVGRFVRVQHASGTTVFCATVALPFQANYCAVLIARVHSGALAQTIGISLDNKESFTAALGAEWTVIQVAPNDDLTAGASVNLSFNSGSAMDIDIGYVDVRLGRAGGPLMLPQSKAADAATKSGQFTPTGTAVSNLDSVTPAAARWTREGDVVTVSGAYAGDATAAASTSTSCRLSLPIPSALSSFSQLTGVATSGIAGDGGANVTGDATNDAALFSWQSLTTGSRTFQYFYRYLLV